MDLAWLNTDLMPYRQKVLDTRDQAALHHCSTWVVEGVGGRVGPVLLAEERNDLGVGDGIIVSLQPNTSKISEPQVSQRNHLFMSPTSALW